MATIKAALVRKALVLLDYTYYHFTQCKTRVLMVLIIKAEFQKYLKSQNTLIFYPFSCFESFNFLSFSVFLTAPEHKITKNLAALRLTKLHYVLP